MNLEELVNKIEEIVTSSPFVQTFVYDDTEKIDELHATDYPALLQRSIEDTINVRTNNQVYNIEFFLLDNYYQTDPKTLSEKYSDLEAEGVLIIKELIAEGAIITNEVTVNRSIDAYNDHLCLIKFNFAVQLTNCNDLLTQPSGLTAEYASTTSLDLTWTDRSNAESSYDIYRSLDNATFTLLTSVAADVTSYTDTGLELDTSYYYKVKAISETNRSAFSTTAAGSTVTPITPATPPILENLEVYYNPDLEVYSNAGTILAVDGDNIRQISDQSGNNNTLNQVTASLQPMYNTTQFGNGNAAIESINDGLLVTNTLDFDNSTSFTWYLVYEKTNTTAINYYYISNASGSGNPRSEFWPDLIQIRGTSGSGRNVSYTDSGALKVIAITVDRSADEYKMYANGRYIGASGSQVTNWPVNLGRLFGSQNYTTYFGTQMFYTAAHDATQVEQVSDWLNTKYSFPNY